MTEKDLKILIFAPYYLPHKYGLSVYIDEFSKHLSPSVSKITIFTSKVFEDSSEHELRYKNVEVIRFPAFYLVYNYPFPKFWTMKFWKMLFLLRKIKYDLVVTNGRFFILSFIGVVFAKMKNLRCLHIEHVSNFTILSNRLKNFFARIYDFILGRLVFKMADVNVAPSTDVAFFIKRFDSRKPSIIFNGLNIEEIEQVRNLESIRNKYRDKIIICYLGRLCKWKGIEDSVEIIKSLTKEIREKIIFLIIGFGEDFDKIKKLSKGENSIKMMGEIPRHEAIGILKIADIYLHSAMPGGALSYSLLEAMYCKCAVVATPNEGAKDVIKNEINGYVFGSKEEAINIVSNLISNDKKRRDIAEKASETIMNKFSWDISIYKYQRLIDKLLSNNL